MPSGWGEGEGVNQCVSWAIGGRCTAPPGYDVVGVGEAFGVGVGFVV